jgi:hypothetical protein
MCFILDYIKFWFELNNHKKFEMELKKWSTSKSLEIFNLKMIVCQYSNLPHIYGYHLEKTHL